MVNLAPATVLTHNKPTNHRILGVPHHPFHRTPTTRVHAHPPKEDAPTETLPPGSLGLPGIGELLSIAADGDGFGVRRVERYGKVYKTNVFGPTVMVYEEQEVIGVLTAGTDNIEVTWPSTTSQLVGPCSLNLLTGPAHERVKRQLNTAVNPVALQEYVPLLQSIITDMADSWVMRSTSSFESTRSENSRGGLREKEEHENDGEEKGEDVGGESTTVDVLQECKLLAFATMSACILGLKRDGDTVQRNVQAMDTLAAGFNAPPINLPGLPLRKAIQARAMLLDQVDPVLDVWEVKHGQRDRGNGQRDEEIAQGGANPSMVYVVPGLVRAAHAGDLTRDELRDNAIAALFGNVSAGPTLAKVFQYLGPTHRAAIYQELHAADCIHPQTGRLQQLTLTALNQCPYLDAVVAELLRITPAVPVVFRKAVQAVQLGPFTIPSGWNVWPHLGDAVLRYNRDDFQPERWLQPPRNQQQQQKTGKQQQQQQEENNVSSTNTQNITSTTATQGTQSGQQRGQQSGQQSGRSCPFEFSQPFGVGTRTCLGKNFMLTQMKVAVAVLCAGYSWNITPANPTWTLVPSPRFKTPVGLCIQHASHPPQ